MTSCVTCVGEEVTIWLEPPEAAKGQSLSIICTVSTSGASSLVLRENGSIVNDSRLFSGGRLTATHKDFTLNPVRREDNGRTFVCSFFESNSDPVTLNVTDSGSAEPLPSEYNCILKGAIRFLFQLTPLKGNCGGKFFPLQTS